MLKKTFLLFLGLITIVMLIPTFSSAEVLWDQPLSTEDTFAYLNQDAGNPTIISPLPPYRAYIADDFDTDGKSWSISKIFVPGHFRSPRAASSLMNATSLHWQIYGDAGGKPDGDPDGGGNPPIWSLSLPTTDPQVKITEGSGGFLSNATLTLSKAVVIPPGRRWFVFYPSLDRDVYGGQGRQPSDTTNLSVAQFIKPYGPYYTYPTVWTDIQTIYWYSFEPPRANTTKHDFAFRIEGTAFDPSILVTPESINFGSVVPAQTSVAQTVTITNVGSTNLVLNSTIVGPDQDMFDVAPGVTNGCSLTGQSLDPQTSCTLDVTFTPTTLGSKEASLRITTSLDPNVSIGQVALSGIGGEDVPSVPAGTVGTQITISGSGFGTKKGTVFIGTTKTKIAPRGWTPTSITCILNKVIPPQLYDIKIQLQPYKTATPKIIANAFEVKKPIMESLSFMQSAPNTKITISGQFFGTKKGQVYMGNQKCKVKSWKMVPTTGASTIVFVVPKKIVPGQYQVKVVNKVGESAETILFTVL